MSHPLFARIKPMPGAVGSEGGYKNQGEAGAAGAWNDGVKPLRLFVVSATNPDSSTWYQWKVRARNEDEARDKFLAENDRHKAMTIKRIRPTS